MEQEVMFRDKYKYAVYSDFGFLVIFGRFNRMVTLLALLLASTITNAEQPTCSSDHGGYCEYKGLVQKIYVNDGNLILIYFDTPVPLEVPASIGLNISKGQAAAFKIDNNPEFARLFYSTALSAQATSRPVSIQMIGTEGGYLKFDRIWLAAPN
ncbi:hypothetical protein GCM10009092_01210 [Bowmanella denitrificans]|uniref:Uncharacterized protein n=1 Tax=Bowmanella denitrificans TaxID=366582 RepID=A0ABP3GA16_9ALTE